MWDWDEPKRQANLAKHGVDFRDIDRLDLSSATSEPDLRRDYGEERVKLVGLVGDRLYVVIIAPRGERLRLISFRKANEREKQTWNMPAK